MKLSLRKPAVLLAGLAALTGASMVTPQPAAALETTCYYERTTTTYYEDGIMVRQDTSTRLLYCITTPS